jgi:hypothetical protein
MTHFSDTELVDLVEDTLEPRRAAHAETCAACREQADTLRAILRDAKAVDVPAPSPLFWEHFPARVRATLAEEPGPGRAGWLPVGVRGLMSFAAAAALIIAVFSGVMLVRGSRGGQPLAPLVAGNAAVAVTGADARVDGTPDAENAEVWAVLTAAASDVEFEDAHDAGMHVYPAAIDHAVQDLSAAERAELGRLLQSELKHASN